MLIEACLTAVDLFQKFLQDRRDMQEEGSDSGETSQHSIRDKVTKDPSMPHYTRPKRREGCHVGHETRTNVIKRLARRLTLRTSQCLWLLLCKGQLR